MELEPEFEAELMMPPTGAGSFKELAVFIAGVVIFMGGIYAQNVAMRTLLKVYYPLPGLQEVVITGANIIVTVLLAAAGLYVASKFAWNIEPRHAGTLVMNGKHIKGYGRTFVYNDIEEVEVVSSHYKGEPSNEDGNHNGENILVIKKRSGYIHKFNFMLESEQQRRLMLKYMLEINTATGREIFVR
jgi:hypothetical protein